MSYETCFQLCMGFFLLINPRGRARGWPRLNHLSKAVGVAKLKFRTAKHGSLGAQGTISKELLDLLAALEGSWGTGGGGLSLTVISLSPIGPYDTASFEKSR